MYSSSKLDLSKLLVLEVKSDSTDAEPTFTRSIASDADAGLVIVY